MLKDAIKRAQGHDLDPEESIPNLNKLSQQITDQLKAQTADSRQAETVVSNAKRRKLFLPICKVHHITFSYGFVLLPIFKWTIGIFEFGGNCWKTGNWKPKWGVKVVCKNKFHNCTWTGRY